MIKLSLYFGLGLLLCCNAAEFGGRIIGGRQSQPEDAVAVTIYSLRQLGDLNGYLTSGVAISSKVVLGAAQAVRTRISGIITDFSVHKIGFDSIYMDNQDVVEIDHVVVHDRYNVDSLQYNIAAFHLASPSITRFVPFEFVGNIAIPNAVKILGYGAPNINEDYSRELLTTIAGGTNECAPILNSLVYGPTNLCIRAELALAQSDQGGPVTNSWLTPDEMSLFSLVSYWTASDPYLVILTNLKHIDIELFVRDQVCDDVTIDCY